MPGFRSQLCYSVGELTCMNDLTSPRLGFLIYKMEIFKKMCQLIGSVKDLNEAINNQMPYLTYYYQHSQAYCYKSCSNISYNTDEK